MSPHSSLRSYRRIAIFRALNLGDILCSIPAIRGLKSACPNASITLIGLPGMAGVATRFSKYFNGGFTSFPGAPGLPEQDFNYEHFVRFLERGRAAEYDLVVQMHGKGSVTNTLVGMLNSKETAGYFEQGEYCPDRKTYMPYPEDLPEIERHVKLAQFLGADNCDLELEFPISSEEWAESDLLRTHYGLNEGFVCIHPGARDIRRWWAPTKFAEVAHAFIAQGRTVVFTGTEPERDIVQHIQNLVGRPTVNLVGKTDTGTLGALIARAGLLVSNDTGVSHIAAALGTPSVVIFLTSDPNRWAPLNRDLHRVVLADDADSISTVLLQAQRVLDGNRGALRARENSFTS